MIVNDTITPELERIKAEFEKLKEMKLHIGIQGGNGFGAGGEGREGAPADILTIANVHEFGATIHACALLNRSLRRITQDKRIRCSGCRRACSAGKADCWCDLDITLAA